MVRQPTPDVRVQRSAIQGTGEKGGQPTEDASELPPEPTEEGSLCVCMCDCVCVCVCVCACLHTCSCVCAVYVCVCVCVCVDATVCVYEEGWLYTLCVCACVYVQTCAYSCM